MSAAVILADPVPVEAIAAPLDRFHCPVYDARLTARSCLDRQHAAREAGPRGHYGKCFDCAIGKRVAERMNAPQAADVVAPCAYDGCKKGATEGKWCTFHARIAPNKGLAPVKRRPLSEDPELAAAAAATPGPTEAIDPSKLRRKAARVAFLVTELAAGRWGRKRQAELASLWGVRRETVSVMRAEAGRILTVSQFGRELLSTESVAEEVPVAKQCSKDGCKREADATKGDGALCMPHHRGVLNAEIQAGKPKKPKPAPKRTAPAAHRATPKRAPPKTKPSLAAELSHMDVLRSAVEALELVDAIGWDLARQLAARVQQAPA